MAECVPKQAFSKDAKYYAEILGHGTQDIAHKIVAYISPLVQGSIIHDNACGQGVAAKAIMAQSPHSITIHATDIWPEMVDATQQVASQNGWPIECAKMPSENLTFTDNLFTHTVMNFGIRMVQSSTSAAAEVYRTLKPGGTAIFTIWAESIFIRAIAAGHERTRPKGTSPPGLKHWMKLEQLSDILQNAGFDPRKIRYEKAATYIDVTSPRRWSEITWSFMGAGEHGWNEEDEVRWDEAIEASMKVLEEWEGFEKKDDGTGKITLTAHVVIVEK
ncbi:S-adenosyl-L-methionine-dependent methyltransferase [Periconia macrospinosa]|uniref:S-adenosyl-L-methionine-dependent methyltransferase n=1 Tax=Periconia macrospinosa TaxID=97972 RepID=A0A2V1E188_9PLEO|nr:S-adenosyl-L-methionine-dependent methyltransferase [Periconia macrospinosa]